MKVAAGLLAALALVSCGGSDAKSDEPLRLGVEFEKPNGYTMLVDNLRVESEAAFIHVKTCATDKANDSAHSALNMQLSDGDDAKHRDFWIDNPGYKKYPVAYSDPTLLPGTCVEGDIAFTLRRNTSPQAFIVSTDRINQLIDLR